MTCYLTCNLWHSVKNTNERSSQKVWGLANATEPHPIDINGHSSLWRNFQTNHDYIRMAITTKFPLRSLQYWQSLWLRKKMLSPRFLGFLWSWRLNLWDRTETRLSPRHSIFETAKIFTRYCHLTIAIENCQMRSERTVTYFYHGEEQQYWKSLWVMETFVRHCHLRLLTADFRVSDEGNDII